MVLGPVLVTAGVPARTANDATVPSPTGAGPAAFTVCPATSMPIARLTAAPPESNNLARETSEVILLSPWSAIAMIDVSGRPFGGGSVRTIAGDELGHRDLELVFAGQTSRHPRHARVCRPADAAS